MRFATERRGDLAFDPTMHTAAGRGSGESTMETFLGGLAFAGFILAQFAAVVAVQRESRIHQPKSFDSERFDSARFDSAHLDHLQRVIRNSAG